MRPHVKSDATLSPPAVAEVTPPSDSESLRQPEEFLRTVSDKLPRAVLYQAAHRPDGSFRFTYVSNGIEELAGVSAAYVLEHTEALTAPIIEEDQPAFWAAVERSLRTLLPLDHVCRTRRPGGELRWCHFRSSVRPEPDGTIVCEGIEMDITEVKIAEEALLESQTRHQIDRLEIARASRLTMLGEIAASLAHELNQPLAAIVSNAQAAQRFMATGNVNLDDMDDILGDIAAQGMRAGEVIKRLRGWIDRDHPPREPLCVSQVIADVEHLIRSELTMRHVQMTTCLAERLPKIIGDRVQLQQVIVNLVLNAVEAMNGRLPEERHVNVRTSLHDGEVVVEVADRGPGIHAEHLDRLFDAFFTTKPEGLGMGLRICASIVRGHGGRIWAHNNEDSGATFCFTLPVDVVGE
jgi:C4-dicarboxylate-specific signal transduction histidine kinase